MFLESKAGEFLSIPDNQIETICVYYSRAGASSKDIWNVKFKLLRNSMEQDWVIDKEMAEKIRDYIKNRRKQKVKSKLSLK